MKHQEKEAPTSSEIERVVGLGLRVKRRVREKNGPHAVADCPFCGKVSKLYVNLDTGLWDCVTGNTKVVTRAGTKPIRDLVNEEHELLSHLGWQRAPVKSGGIRKVFAVTMERDRRTKVVKTTAGHRWILRDGTERTTARLQPGDKLASVIAPLQEYAELEGIQAGINFGDGQGGAIELWGPKQRLEKFLDKTTVVDIGPTQNGVFGVRVNGQNKEWKSLPSLERSDAWLLGWLQGYFATDGCAGGACIDSADEAALVFAREVATRVGIATASIRRDWRKGFPGYEGWMYRLTFMRGSLKPSFFLRDDQRDEFFASGMPAYQRLCWRVASVQALEEQEEVFCAIVEGAETFALDDNLLTGNCKVCEEGGSLWKLADKVGIRVRSDDRRLVKHFASVIADGNTRAKIALDVPVRDAQGLDLAAITTASQRCFDEADKAGAAVRAYLASRCIEDDTIKRFKLGVSWIRDKGSQPELALGIPYLAGDKVPLLKMRNLEADKDKRKFRRTAGGDSLLFNADGIKGCRQVVLVEGELDAISLWQLGVHNVASTSLGAKKTLPDEWLALLADADDIVLWYDDDDKGQEVVASVATQLGTYRCRLAQMPTGLDAKDANDLMMRLPQEEACDIVAKVIEGARSLVLSNVVTPSHFADALAQEIMDGEKTLGVSTGWPEIDRSIMGIRMGELTMVTGHTAHGKTSWTLDLVNNLAKQGVPVLVSALENGPLSIARKIFQKIFHMSPASLITDEHKQRALAVLGLLDKDPLFILDLYGLHSIDEIIDQVRFAVRRHGIKVFMFDHLHFLKVGAKDMVQHYDEALHKLNALKVELQIHIIVVAHPRGSVLDDVVPMGGDIKGCSSAKQIADNGFSVYRAQRIVDTKKELRIKDSMGRVVEVTLEPFQSLIVCWKARHDDASEDSTILFYNPRSVTYTSQEARDAPIQGAINGQTNKAQDDEDDLFS